MSKIVNNPNPVEEKIQINRNQIEHRATWMGLIYDEMVKAGVADAENILRRAIARCGHIHGARITAQCADPDDCEELCKVFIGTVGESVGPCTFNIEHVTKDHDHIVSEVGYCALLAAWQKLGFDDDRCALLCDIAMDGDRSIAQEMGLKLGMEKCLAAGDHICALNYHK